LRSLELDWNAVMTLRVVVVGVALGCLLCAACATTPASPPVRTPVPEDVRALRLLASSTSVDPACPLSLRGQLFGPAKGDIRDVYRKVAPATVLVRTPGGFGSGAIIDARGYVLTNHHVIAHAESVDFKRRVSVERGKLGPNGVMQLEGPPMVGWVLKSDPLLDLAIIKLDDPPADLKALRVAKGDPSPGEPVSALGNGSIGLLWAIKDGEIASIGKLATHLAQLAGSECRVAASDDALAAETCRKSSRSVEVERERLEQQVPALVIQTSCTLSPGDSGGPLVNRAGELVGVNAFLRSDPNTPVTTNFHVHVAEVRGFLKTVPEAPLAVVPSPFERLGRGGWLDADHDGRVDVYVATQGERTTVLVNFNAQPSLLEADLAVSVSGEQVLAWYDVDGDGVLDRLVVGDRAGVGKAWRLSHETVLGSFLGVAKTLDAATFSGERGARLQAMLPAVELALGLGDKPRGIEAVPSVSSPLVGEARLVDLDRDGVADAVSGRTLEGARLVLDPTQTLGSEARAAFGKQGLVVLERARLRWVLVTTAERSVAFGLERGGDFITHAWALTPAGPGSAQPEWFGRDVGSAVSELLPSAQGPRARKQLASALGTPVRALSQRVPDFNADLGRDAALERVDVPGLELAVVSRVGSASALYFDLDQQQLAKTNPAQREEEARGGRGDFAWFGRDGISWTAADLDHDGAWDVVTVKLGERVVTWRGGVRSEGGKLVDPALFTGARADALKQLAPLFFPAADIADSRGP
jgi:S1-C subfamily serine protease